MNKWLNKLKMKAILPAAALLAAAAIGTTFAWQQWDLSITNELKADTTEIVVNETFKEKELKEKVSFTNTGSSSVFLRVAYSEYWEKTENGKKLLLSNEDENGNEVAKKIWTSAWPDSSSSDAKWTLCPDGWYYYNRSLRAGETTEDILTSAKADTENLPAEYEGANYYLYFKAEVVQCSDGANTNNSDEVNADAIYEIFGRRMTVGGKDKNKNGPYDLNWKLLTVKQNDKDVTDYYYTGTWK